MGNRAGSSPVKGMMHIGNGLSGLPGSPFFDVSVNCSPSFAFSCPLLCTGAVLLSDCSKAARFLL